MTNDNSGITGFVATADLSLSAPTSTVAGADVPVTVTVTDPAGNVKTDFTGTVNLVTSDPRVPAITYTFTAADAGVHTFPIGLKLVTAGAQSIVVTSPFLATAGQSITVDTGPAARIGMTTARQLGRRVNHPRQPGRAGRLRQHGGGVHRDRPLQPAPTPRPSCPADYTFTPADGGIVHLPVVLKTAGLPVDHGHRHRSRRRSPASARPSTSPRWRPAPSAWSAGRARSACRAR